MFNKLKQEGEYLDADFSYGLVLDKRDRRYQTSDGFQTGLIKEFHLFRSTHFIIVMNTQLLIR